jgi:uncharacterized protein
MDELAHIIGDYNAFLETVLKEVVEAGFELTDFIQMDHMCYRVGSMQDYQTKKQELLSIGTLLGENMVNDRPIATFRLHNPVLHDGWRIDALELPAPKPGVNTPEGLDHVEFVIFDDKDVFLKKYANHDFDLKAADRGINPDITLQLPTYRVKFHLLNLPTVVYLENKLGMHDIRDGQ